MSQGVSTKHLYTVFLPAIALGSLVLAIAIARYEPLYPDSAPETAAPATGDPVPLLAADPIIGNKKAPHTIVFFGDFGCEACHAQTKLLLELIDASPQKVKIFWKGLAATRIPYPSDTAHRYAYCANKEGKFLPFAAAVFDTADNLTPDNLDQAAKAAGLDSANIAACAKSPEVAQYMTDTETIARSFSVQSVPTIFLDNKQITPPTTLEGWQLLVQ